MSCEKLRSHHHHHRQHHLLWVCLFLPPPPGPSPEGIQVLDSVVKLHKTKKSMKQVKKRHLVINHTHTLPFTDVKPTKSLGNKICDHGFDGSSRRKHHNNNYVIITIYNFSHQLGKQSTNLPSPKVIVQVLI
jgi:hypothetical protein